MDAKLFLIVFICIAALGLVLGKQITDDGLECYYLAPALDPVKNYLNYEEDTYHA